jgi:hypothetical protein
MSPTTYRRLFVTLFACTLGIVTVDTAAAVQRQATRPPPSIAAPITLSGASAVPVADRNSHPHHRARAQRVGRVRQRSTQVSLRRGFRSKATTLVRRRPAAVLTGPTGWRALDLAIARIPTYRAGAAVWLVSTRYGHWGTADWYHATLYVSPLVPTDRVYDVAVHEWSHELSVLDYGGDVEAAVSAMNSVFSGSGLVGAERAADCMALLQGATWTHYTSCEDGGWRRAAMQLLAGRRL